MNNMEKVIAEVSNIYVRDLNARLADHSDGEAFAKYAFEIESRYAHLRYAVDKGVVTEDALRDIMCAIDSGIWETYQEIKDETDCIYRTFLDGLHEGKAQDPDWQNIVELDLVEV